MGWLISYRPLQRGETVDSRMRDVLRWDIHDGQTGDKHEIIASATVGSTWYACLQITYADGSPVRRVALICLTTNGNGRNGNGFGYKDMDETCGPCEVDCPKHILDLLTPTDSEYANQWRAACHARRAAKASARKTLATMGPGSKVKLAAPIRFRSGFECDAFTIVPTPPRNRGIIAVPTNDPARGLYRLHPADLLTATLIA